MAIPLLKIESNFIDVTESHSRMRASAAVSSRLHHLLDIAEDSKLLGPLAVNAALQKCLVASQAPESETEWHGKPYDFNQDPNLTEAVKCIPLLEALNKRCDEFLEDWPEHATLKQV